MKISGVNYISDKNMEAQKGYMTYLRKHPEVRAGILFSSTTVSAFPTRLCDQPNII